MKNWWLYVLKLERGKYYIGITTKNPEIRMQEHITHIRGAYWTQKYKPLELYYKQDLGVISKDQAEKIENQTTRKYMREYGLNNVRGGDLTSDIAAEKTGEYSKLFGYIRMKRDVDLMIGISIMMLSIVILSILTIKK